MVKRVNRGEAGRANPEQEKQSEAERLIQEHIDNGKPVWVMNDRGLLEEWDVSTVRDGVGRKKAVLMNPETFETKTVLVDELVAWQGAAKAKMDAVANGKSHEEAVVVYKETLAGSLQSDPDVVGLVQKDTGSDDSQGLEREETDGMRVIRLLEEHQLKGEQIRIASMRHGILSVELFELRGDKVTVCGTNESGDKYCTDNIPVRVFIEWDKKHNVAEPIREPAVATAAGAGAGEVPPPENPDKSKEPKDKKKGATLATAAAGAPPTPPTPPNGRKTAGAGGDDGSGTRLATAGAVPPVPPKRGSQAQGGNDLRPVGYGEPQVPVGYGKEAKKTLEVDVAAADITREIENRARDIAEARMNREKEQLRGFSGWLKETFVHNYGREIYRQIEIRKAREQILREGNLYAADGAGKEAHKQAVQAVADRILGEYEEFLHEGEKKKALGNSEAEKKVKRQLGDLLKSYAVDGSMTEEDFQESKKRIIHDALKTDKEYFDGGKMFADSLTGESLEKIAVRIREHAAHANGIDNLDIDLNFTIAKAKLGARTERETNKVDRAIEWLNGLTGGGASALFGNEIAYAVATAYSVGGFVAQRAAGSTAAAWGTFGASAGVAGVIAGMKEKERMRKDRVLHERQRAVNMEIDRETPEERETRKRDLEAKIANAKWHQYLDKRAWRKELDGLNKTPPPDKSPRREEMEKFSFEKASADDLARSLLAMLEEREGVVGLRETSPEAVRTMLAQLADAEARILASDVRKVDLLSYSDATKVEEERRNLDYARALLKSRLRAHHEAVGADPESYGVDPETYTRVSFAQAYGDLVKTARTKFEKNITSQDRAFAALANKKAFWKGTAVAGGAMVFGAAAHEVSSAFSDKIYGIVDFIREKISGGHGPNPLERLTPLAKLVEYVSGAMPTLDASTLHTDVVGSGEFVLPDGVRLEALADGTSRLVYGPDNDVLVDGLHVAGGAFDSASEAKIEALGIGVDTSWTTIDTKTVVPHEFTVPEWLREHGADVVRARRDVWYGNDTPMEYIAELKKWFGADWNELKLWWGGDSQIGVNANGDYVMDMSHMTSWGSWTQGGALGVDPHAALGEHKLVLLLSLTEGAQNQPVEIPVNPDGTIVIPKGSDIAKAFFDAQNGKATFLGRFAEIAEVRGVDSFGRTHYGILATHEGKGVSGLIPGLIEEKASRDVPVTTFDFPAKRPVDVPPIAFPVSWRAPLEPMRKGKGRPGSEGGIAGINGESGEGSETGQMPVNVGELEHYEEEQVPVAETPEPEAKQEKEEMVPADGKRTPEVKLPKQEVEASIASMETYVDSWSPEYRSRIEALAASLPAMDEDARMSIALPAYREGRGIYEALRNYTNVQVDKDGAPLDPKLFEVVVFLNRPNEGVEFDKQTAKEVERFMKKHPAFRVHVMRHTFDFQGKAKMGEIYKTAADVMLYRNLARKNELRKSRHILRTGGADAREKNPRFISNVMSTFENDAYLDQLRTESRQPKEALEKMPLFHFLSTFESGVNRLYTRGKSNVGLGSYSARLYAEAGGFNSGDVVREEVNLARKMRDKLTKETERHDRHLLIKNAIDDPRRAIFALFSGVPYVQKYDNFGDPEREKALRKFNWEDAVGGKIPETANFTAENLSRELSVFYRAYIDRSVRYSETADQMRKEGKSAEEIREASVEMVNKLFRKMFFIMGLGKEGAEYAFVPGSTTGEARIDVKDLAKVNELMEKRKFNYWEGYSEE